MYLFRPQLLESLADYSRAKFMKDLVAGVIVAIIALPLSIALALASGVSPEQGLYTAIVAGFLISALGGSKVQIAGPTAAFASIVAGIVARNGMDGLAVATVLAGILLILMGVLRMGSMIKFIPYTITTGFTAGIAVTIVVGQLKDFFGVTFQNSPVETVEKLEKFFACFSTWSVSAVAVGCVALVIQIVWPRFFAKIPASLVAQGVGNTASALFGGIPATGAIARTAANIKNGGVSPVAGMVHAGVLVLVLVLLMPYAALIPMPCIAAILFVVAYNMSGWRTFVRVVRQSPKSDTAVLLLTFFLTVAFDLVVAIGVGLTLACLLFMKRMADVAVVEEWEYVEDTQAGKGRFKHVPVHVMVYEINGPMFFGAADKIPHIDEGGEKRVLILRMRSVPALDITALKGLRRLWEECGRAGVQLVFSHVNEQPMSVLKKSGLYQQVGKENFCPNIDAALKRAMEL